MTRHLDRQDSDIPYQGYLPGCVWSVLHILDYHYWHSSRKLSALRKHRRGKHTICCGYPKTVSFEHYADEAHEYLDADAVPLIDEQKTMEATLPADRSSAKAHVKALIAKEMSARLQMQRADSFRHLRSSDSLGGVTTDWSNPIIILERSADASDSRLQVPSLEKSPGDLTSDTGDKLLESSLNKNYPDGATKLSREISHRQIMECMDVLEIFKINKNMFLEILQDPDVKSAKKFHEQLTTNAKARLKKSGSFPLASSPDNRQLRPTTLEHKSRETWLHRRGENCSSEDKDSQSNESKSLEDFLHMPKSTQANDTVVLAVSEESGFASSPMSQQGSNKHGRHQSFMGHLKCMIKKLKHGLRESRSQTNQTSADALLHRVSSGSSSLSTDEKDIPRKSVDVAIHQDGSENRGSCHETSSSSKNLSRGQLSSMRRVSSLNESMDRYARLFETSSTREEKWHEKRSNSLRLTNEDKNLSTGYRIKSFKRRLSLQDIDSFFPLPNEATHEAPKSDIPIKTDCDEITKNESRNDSSMLRTHVDGENTGPLDVVKESECHKNTVEEGNGYEQNEFTADCTVGIEEIFNNGEQHEPERERHISYQYQDTGSNVGFRGEHDEESLVSVVDCCVADHINGQTDIADLIGSELDCRQNFTDEANSSVNQSSRDSCNSADQGQDKNPLTEIGNHFLHSEIEEVDDTDLNYVKDVLEVSGLIEQGYLGSWHSLDQPLSPTLFKELEVYLHPELSSSSEDADSDCDHRLLFDSINEELLQMYGSSLAYFPKSFSFAQRVRPLPKGSHILEEVWKRINWHRVPKSNMEQQSLDDIVARDLGKDESWMDLQLDLEDIALDLEEWIFDELVDEIMSS